MRMVSLAIALGFSTLVLGQTTQPTTAPATAPTVKAVNAERTLDELLRSKPGSARPIQPAAIEENQADRASTEESLAPAAKEVLLKREGDLVSQRVMRLVKGKNGFDWELHYASDGKALQDPPLIALENLNLARMQEQQKTAGRELKFNISGVLTQYRGRNYLLIEKAMVVADEPR